MSETSWYHQNGAEPAGPFDETAIRGKIAQGLIRCDTLLWKEGMTEWAQARHTEFDTEFDPYQVGAHAVTQSVIPALPGAAAGNASSVPAWCLAGLPLALILLLPFASVAISLIGFVLYLGILIWDVSSVKAAGCVPSRSYWWPIVLGGFGAPIYLWRRGNKLDKQRGYFVLSLASIATYILVTVVAVGSGAVGP